MTLRILTPHPSLSHSVSVLSREDLGRQRFDARHVLTALRAARNGRPMTSDQEPAVQAWRGYDSALALYLTLAIREWEARGYTSTIQRPYSDDWTLSPGEDSALEPDARCVQLPRWLGDEGIAAANRLFLIRRDPDWYGQFGWESAEVV